MSSLVGGGWPDRLFLLPTSCLAGWKLWRESCPSWGTTCGTCKPPKDQRSKHGLQDVRAVQNYVCNQRPVR